MLMTQETTFPFVQLRGSHRQIGHQFGEATAALVRRHRDLALARLGARSGIPVEQALAAAMRYRPFVIEHARFLDEEIQGVATGAGIALAEAYLLQLRSELAVTKGLYSSGEPGDECTTFAIQGEATSDGEPLVGQNADLPAFYRGIAVMAEIVSDEAPAVLMLLPAGQVSYIGINDRGLGVFANFLTCDGWRLGYPRYLLSRLALTHETVDDAIAAFRSVPRASSRNMIVADRHGAAADLETTPTRDARLEPANGILTHANHYTAPLLVDEERSPAKDVANSRVRQARMQELLEERRGSLNAQVMQEILRDRATEPDALCRHAEDDANSDFITFASVIAEPARGQMWVAVGPPDQHPYRRYALSSTALPAGTPRQPVAQATS